MSVRDQIQNKWKTDFYVEWNAKKKVIIKRRKSWRIGFPSFLNAIEIATRLFTKGPTM